MEKWKNIGFLHGKLFSPKFLYKIPCETKQPKMEKRVFPKPSSTPPKVLGSVACFTR